MVHSKMFRIIQATRHPWSKLHRSGHRIHQGKKWVQNFQQELPSREWIHIPPNGKKENHRLKDAILGGDMLVPWRVTSWWLNQPIWKICSSNWKSFPIFGMKIKHIWNHQLVNHHHQFAKRNQVCFFFADVVFLSSMIWREKVCVFVPWFFGGNYFYVQPFWKVLRMLDSIKWQSFFGV